MKVILTQELKGRGGEGDVIDVARGFAVNYLLPRGIAISATPGNMKQLEHRMHNITKRETGRLTGASSYASNLDGKTVVIAAKVGDEGRLFGSITAQMIAAAIAEQFGVEVDRRKIETHGHIKELGDHDAEISVYRDIKAQIVVSVVSEAAVKVAEVAADEAIAEAVVEGASDVAVEVEVTVDETTNEVVEVETVVVEEN
ncbi:MAG: 50S ribosomal protein L9 [Coriobacteriia bacterium]|nr:50S ribosomal protein L9 [Coriobacteriia bacterium]